MRDHEKSIGMIEQDMAHSRAEIERTSQELRGKMDADTLSEAARQVILESTQRVENHVKALAEQAPGKLETLGDQAMDYFLRNPLPALLAGLGVGLLITMAERDVISSTTAATPQTSGRLGQAIASSPRLSTMQRRTVRQARRANRNHPLLLAAASLGAGLLLGSLLPNTRREHELMGSTRDRLMESGKETAQQAMQQAKVVIEEELDKRKADLAELKDAAEESALLAYNEAVAQHGEEETADRNIVTP